MSQFPGVLPLLLANPNIFYTLRQDLSFRHFFHQIFPPQLDIFLMAKYKERLSRQFDVYLVIGCLKRAFRFGSLLFFTVIHRKNRLLSKQTVAKFFKLCFSFRQLSPDLCTQIFLHFCTNSSISSQLKC
jgi:hypothetical protein